MPRLAKSVLIAAILAAPTGYLSPASAFGGSSALAKAETAASQATASDPSAAERQLIGRLDRLFAHRILNKAQVTFQVQDLVSGRTLYEVSPDLALNPASNSKLLTTLAALEELGPTFRFRTEARSDAEIDSSGTLNGNLYLVTSGDPTLVNGDLYEIALDLYAKGLRRITGKVIVDTSRYDGEGWPPGFDQKDEIASYRTPIGAANINFNTFVLWVRPGQQVGDQARIEVVPAHASVEIRNEATTHSSSAFRARVAGKWEADGKLVVSVSGQVGSRSSPRSFRYPVQSPSSYFIAATNKVLQDVGIRLSRRGSSTGKAPDQTKLLGAHVSAPVGTIIRTVNKQSSNYMAELLLMALDTTPGGTGKSGAAKLQTYAKERGIASAGFQVANGSGLYDNNRMSAAQVVRLLTYAKNQLKSAPEFLASLSVMGVDGTARRRLRTTKAAGWVRVKTGTLNGVSALSGYVDAPGKSSIAFSLIVNGFDTWRLGQVQRLQDGVVFALSNYLHNEEQDNSDPESPIEEASESDAESDPEPRED